MKVQITDEELENLIKERLKEDPEHFLHFLKVLIDGLPTEIPDKTLFKLLKPTFTDDLSELSDGDIETLSESLTRQDIINDPTELRSNHDSVDMLFYPEVRRKLKSWQKTFFDKTSTEKERKLAKNKINKTFTSLIYVGQGRRKQLSEEAQDKILSDYSEVRKKCKQIFEKSKNSSANKKLLIKEAFNDIGGKVLKDNPYIHTHQQLRDLILAERHHCSVRTIQEFIKNNGSSPNRVGDFG